MPLTLRVHGCGMSMADGVRGGGGLPRSRELMKPKCAPGSDVVQFVERFVVALVVGDEQLAGAIERQAHRETMAGGDRRQGERVADRRTSAMRGAKRRTLP